MTSINRLDFALTALRQTLTARSGAHQPVVRQQVRELSASEKSEKSKKVKQRIKKGLAGLNLSLASDQERGASIFLETVLADEFGAGLLADPAFHNLLSDVRAAMLENVDTQRDLVTMLADLQGTDE